MGSRKTMVFEGRSVIWSRTVSVFFFFVVVVVYAVVCSR